MTDTQRHQMQYVEDVLAKVSDSLAAIANRLHQIQEVYFDEVH